MKGAIKMTKYEKITYMQQCLQIAKEEMDRGIQKKNEEGRSCSIEHYINQSLVNDNLRNVARIAFRASRME